MEEAHLTVAEMADEYQRGSDQEWLKHSNDELTRLIKRRERQIKVWKIVSLMLFLALAWVVFRYGRRFPLETLWK